MTRPSDVPRPSPDPPAHWHRFGVIHRHPDWHGHCEIEHDVGVAATRHFIRGHDRDVLLCSECIEDSRSVTHSCRRWHFHLPFKHRHTETGR